MTANRDRTCPERGASAVEYGMLLTGIAVVVMAAVILFGPRVSNLFTSACSSIPGDATHSCTK